MDVRARAQRWRYGALAVARNAIERHGRQPRLERLVLRRAAKALSGSGPARAGPRRASPEHLRDRNPGLFRPAHRRRKRTGAVAMGRGAWLRESNSYPLSAQDMAALRAANLHDRAPDRLVAARPPRGRIRMGPRGCNPRSNRDRGILLRCGLRPLDGDLSTAGRAMESVVRRLCARRAPDAPLARLPAPRILAAPRVSGPLFASVRIQFLDTMGHRALRSGAELLAG